MKKPKDFLFKQFRISHDKSTHKVGTDGVLLGAWANLSDCKTVLDVGTGTGLIALMIAQRSPSVSIDAIDIQKDDAEQALINVNHSPWRERINVMHVRLQDFVPTRKYDLIVSNPPYFIDSYKPSAAGRSLVRHTEALPFIDLIKFAVQHLSGEGRLALILPTPEAKIFGDLAANHGLYPIRTCAFRGRAGKPIERLIMEYSRAKDLLVTDELVLHADGNAWSEDYKALTRAFYIHI